MLVLSAYVAARLVVAGRFDTTWPLVTAVTMLISEVNECAKRLRYCSARIASTLYCQIS